MANVFVIGALRMASKASSPPASPPNPPGSVTASIVNLAVSGAFVDQATDEVDFLVERQINGGAWATLSAPLALTGTGLQGTFSDTLNADETARYRVTARNASGNSVAVQSPVVTATPLAPSGLALNGAVNPGSVPLTFQDNSSVEGAFELERSPNGTTSFVKVGNDIPARVGTGSVNVSDTTVTPSSGPYYYRARSKVVGGGGASAYSNVAGPFSTPASTGSAPIAQFWRVKSPGYVIELDTSLSTDPDGGALTSRQIDWGDGTVESHPTQVIFFHTYAGPGPYTQVLTVTKSDGQTHSRTSQVWPKLDRSHDFTDNYSTGQLAAAHGNIFYRSTPSNSQIVSGKAAKAPSTFSVEKFYPAKPHGQDNQTATEQRMGCNEELSELHCEEYWWYPDGTEGWANDGPLAATQPTLPRYYHREQNPRNIANCSTVASSNVISTTTTGILNMDDHGPTGIPSPGQQFAVTTAFRLPGTFTSDGAGNLVGSGTSWLTHLGLAYVVIVAGKNYEVTAITDDTHCKLGSLPQQSGGNNQPPAAGAALTMAYAAHIVDIDSSGSPVLVTVDRNAFNTVGPATGVVQAPGFGENNKLNITWDNNNNYSGDLTQSTESSPGSTFGDSKYDYKPAGKGAKAIGINNKSYGVEASCDMVTDATRGQMVRVLRSYKLSRHLADGGCCKVEVYDADDVLIDSFNKNTGITKPVCSDPRGNNFMKSWYVAGWANAGFSKDTSMFLCQQTFWTIAPSWFTGWA